MQIYYLVRQLLNVILLLSFVPFITYSNADTEKKINYFRKQSRRPSVGGTMQPALRAGS